MHQRRFVPWWHLLKTQKLEKLGSRKLCIPLGLLSSWSFVHWSYNQPLFQPESTKEASYPHSPPFLLYFFTLYFNQIILRSAFICERLTNHFIWLQCSTKKVIRLTLISENSDNLIGAISVPVVTGWHCDKALKFETK